MSGRKRKFTNSAAGTSTTNSIQHTFSQINDVIVSVKAHLSDSRLGSRQALENELHHLATLATTFGEQRPRAANAQLGSDWADILDREGVNIWNAAAAPDGSENRLDRRGLTAALRLAGYRLIEAGIEKHPSVDTLIHILLLASKTGIALSEAGKADIAATVLSSAAKFEDQARKIEDADGNHQQAKAQAFVVYYTSRMEASWQEANENMAWFMLEKIHDLEILPRPDQEQLCLKILDIGKSILRSATTGEPACTHVRAAEAVKWLQKAFGVMEGLESDKKDLAPELKRSVLRSLGEPGDIGQVALNNLRFSTARAYFLSSENDPENLNRAAATLDELLTDMESRTSQNTGGSDFQQLRWMRLAVSKRQNVSNVSLLEALSAIVEHMPLDESEVTDVLQELRTLMPQHHALATTVLQTMLLKALGSVKGSAFVDRILLTLLFHCAKDVDHARGLKEVGNACDTILRSDFGLPKVPTTACLTLLWQFGGRMYDIQKWEWAADWFLAGTHPVFKSMAISTSAKCFRKAALCYINQRDYARAATIVRRCPDEEATTCYVRFLAASRQGLEREATEAVQDMVKAPDFDKRMLLLATQLAHESDMKDLLLSILEALLIVVRNTLSSVEAEIEAVTLVRCVIRLLCKRLDYPGYDRNIVLDSLLEHFATARELLGMAVETKGAALLGKDIAWLWRTAYNLAVRACSEWVNEELRVSAFFQVAKSLLEISCEVSLAELDANMCLHIIYAGFASITARVFLLRAQGNHVERPLDQRQFMDEINADIRSSLNFISSPTTRGQIQDDKDASKLGEIKNTLYVFAVELCCRRMDWQGIPRIIEDAGHCDAPAHHTFEAIADILWDYKECPVDVLYTALDAILHASLNRSALSISKFSRWLRAICTISLARNTSSDRSKAIGYVEQAVAVLKDQEPDDDEDNTYPLDERQWLLATAYNTGIECLHACLLDEARRWFESSTAVCRFVPDGNTKAEKISETYSRLLERYTC